MSDHGLVIELSDALAGALNGVGHSTIYNEKAVYSSVQWISTLLMSDRLCSMAVRYHFEVQRPSSTLLQDVGKLAVHHARSPNNPYHLPWALRGLLEDPRVQELFSSELVSLREQFEKWDPVSKALCVAKLVCHRLRAQCLADATSSSDWQHSLCCRSRGQVARARNYDPCIICTVCTRLYC